MQKLEEKQHKKEEKIRMKIVKKNENKRKEKFDKNE